MKPGPKFLRSVLEVSHVEFQTYDLAAHKVLFSSGMVSKILGYTDEEYIELSQNFYLSIIHPDDVAVVERGLQKIFHSKRGDVIEMTVRARKKDGGYLWLHSRQMIYERTPDDKKFVTIREVEDITRLMEIRAELEEKVQQLKLISYKNSHLVRAPVATIMGLVGLMEDHGISGEHNQQIIAYLKETIAKLDEVVYDINNDAQLKK